MAEFEVNGITYKNKKLSAMDQLDLMLDLSPLLVSINNLRGGNGIDAAGQIAAAFAGLPREKTHTLIATCLGSCERKMPSGKGYAKIWNEPAHQPMFDDIGLMEIGGIVMAVLQDNFASFLPGSALNS
jgi:hypothetical protein